MSPPVILLNHTPDVNGPRTRRTPSRIPVYYDTDSGRDEQVPDNDNDAPGDEEDEEDELAVQTVSVGSRAGAAYHDLSPGVIVQPRIRPKSQDPTWKPPLAPLREWEALATLQNFYKPDEGAMFVEYRLSDFSAYLPDNVQNASEMRGLQDLASKRGHTCLLFDGYLSTGNTRCYVQGVPFEICSIGNYGEDLHEVGSDIWIQSRHNKKSQIFYRLGAPSSEYSRYHQGFLWLANLAKHFVDFSLASEDSISINSFRSNFSAWLRRHHGSSPAFRCWYKKFGKDDFRTHVAANISFLFKEAVGVVEGDEEEEKALREQPLWAEVLERDSIPMQKIEESKTIVTPYVLECFKDTKFGHLLKAPGLSQLSKRRQTLQGDSLDLTATKTLHQPLMSAATSKAAVLQNHGGGTELRSPEALSQHMKMIKSIRPGDILAVTKDGEDGVWKDELGRFKVEADHCWYACVQVVHQENDRKISFDALWIYRPSDTACAKMKYPFPNELFLSNNCTCISGHIMEDDVLDIVPMIWYGHPTNASANFFIRQTWLDNEKFVTLKDSHKICEHQLSAQSESATAQQPGDSSAQPSDQNSMASGSASLSTTDSGEANEDESFRGMPSFKNFPRLNILEGSLLERNSTPLTGLSIHSPPRYTASSIRPLAVPATERCYPVGQTVLAVPNHKSNHGLEPYEVMNYGKANIVSLRQLLRRHDVDGSGRANELIYTENIVDMPVKRIIRKCHVRFYTANEVGKQTIPAPYNRDGIGNAFYIASRVCNDELPLKPIPIDTSEDIPQSMLQGFDPRVPPSRRKLRGMDLYCGGGNFGRGLEEGGAVHNEWAVDINQKAIHTYAANLEDPDQTKLFYGSVNDLLSQAMQGNPKDSSLIPLPGDVDFISAGSPCQGFSCLNPNRDNEKGLANQSLVASVASYIDFYRPKYGILENVMNMVKTGKNREDDVLSQLVCALVGMGYQVQLFMLDPWSCGNPQSRQRLFVSFAAPGKEPLEHPGLSHSHPPNIGQRGLGQLANGESFGRRIHEPTPFKFVTASEATTDLPDIGDGFTHQCIEYPEHVLASCVREEFLAQTYAIPVFPRGSNFASAWKNGKGVMTREQRGLFPLLTNRGKLPENVKSISKAWGRVDPAGVFGTVVVKQNPRDARAAHNLHWDQHRPITVMEAKRAQGFPDNEVLLGTPLEQWKILGNSVARGVSLSLGLALREAWLKNDLVFESMAGQNTPQSSMVSAKDLQYFNVPGGRARFLGSEHIHYTPGPGVSSSRESGSRKSLKRPYNMEQDTSLLNVPRRKLARVEVPIVVPSSGLSYHATWTTVPTSTGRMNKRGVDASALASRPDEVDQVRRSKGRSPLVRCSDDGREETSEDEFEIPRATSISHVLTKYDRSTNGRFKESQASPRRTETVQRLSALSDRLCSNPTTRTTSESKAKKWVLSKLGSRVRTNLVLDDEDELLGTDGNRCSSLNFVQTPELSRVGSTEVDGYQG